LVREAVMAQGFYRQWPGEVRSRGLEVGYALMTLLIFLIALLLPPALLRVQLEGHPLILLFSFLSTIVLITLFARVMPRRTPKGMKVLRQTLGFQEFLRRVDAPRFNTVIRTPELFERFLPYAMVAGLTSAWARAFAGIVQEPPRWYHSGDDYCCRITSRAMVSSPSNFGSGSSGASSGGGSLGDGGGGGF
jgi:uncharacterized membrane protein YgcG